MSNINQSLEIIRNAVYGKDMRKAIHDAISDLANNYTSSGEVKNAFAGVFPEYNPISTLITITSNSSLMEEHPYLTISDESFRPAVDGLLMWRNSLVLIPVTMYSFDEQSDPGRVRVYFNAGLSFQERETLRYTIYKKPQTNSAPIGDALFSVDGVVAASIGIAQDEEED